MRGRSIAGIAVASLVAGNAHGYGAGTGARRRAASIPTVRVGRATVMGALSPEVIRRVTLRNINQLRFCYDQALLHLGVVEGTLTIRYVIGPQGTVQTALVSQSTVADAQLTACFVNVVRRWQFPSPDGGGIVTVVAPFALAMTS